MVGLALHYIVGLVAVVLGLGHIVVVPGARFGLIKNLAFFTRCSAVGGRHGDVEANLVVVAGVLEQLVVVRGRTRGR